MRKEWACKIMHKAKARMESKSKDNRFPSLLQGSGFRILQSVERFCRPSKQVAQSVTADLAVLWKSQNKTWRFMAVEVKHPETLIWHI